MVLYETDVVILLLLNSYIFNHLGWARSAVYQSARLLGSS